MGSDGEEKPGEGSQGRSIVASQIYFLVEPACFNSMPATKATSAASSHCIRQD